ncbi:MAG: hypothetical protein P8N56_03325, partial [Schleiferiaceae bacterium]|nr:hypothetical protein [Schleiferiaceae bacterium]
KADEVRSAMENSEFNGIKVKLDPVEHHVGRYDRPRDDNGSRMRGRGGRPGGGGFSGGGRRDSARPQGRPYNRSPRR